MDPEGGGVARHLSRSIGTCLRMSETVEALQEQAGQLLPSVLEVLKQIQESENPNLVREKHAVLQQLFNDCNATLESLQGAHLTIEQQETILSQQRATYEHKCELHKRWADMGIFESVREIAANVEQKAEDAGSS